MLRENFRKLTPAEVEDFRLWSRANYKPGDPVPAVWHPVCRHEAEAMNTEEVQK
jgi:hypothetical protein